MKIVAESIHPNEACYGLFEGPRNVPQVNGSTVQRWIQAVYVIRGDAIAEYTTDYGPAEDFELVMPLVIPNDGDDSVAALQYHADKNRQDTYWAMRRAQMLKDSTLIPDVINQIERKSKPSVFGPAVRRQKG